MAKPINFSSASKRHYHDAELLFTNSCIPNAGHLFGFAAECGLKALLVSHGLQTDPITGDIQGKNNPYKVHINVLINNVQTFPGSRQYYKYIGMMPKLKKFRDWHIDHRYHDESLIPASHNDWREAAREVMTMLDQAKTDMVIT